MSKKRLLSRTLILAGLLLVVVLQFSLLSSPASADGDPVEECDGEWVLVEYSGSDGHTYSEVECRPDSGLPKWLWLVGVLAAGGAAVYGWNARSGSEPKPEAPGSSGSQSAGGSDSGL